MHHDNDFTSTLLARIAAQRRIIAALCRCGRVGKVYGEDGRTLYCVDCWLKIYGEATP